MGALRGRFCPSGFCDRMTKDPCSAVGGPGSTILGETSVGGCCRLCPRSWQGQLLSSSRTLAVAHSKTRSQSQREKSSVLRRMRCCVSRR